MQKNNGKVVLRILSIVLCGIASASYAANPASKEYVDQKAAYLQSQINHLSPAAPYSIGSLYPNTQNPDGVVIYIDGHGHGIAAALADAVNPATTAGVTYDSSSNASVYGAPGQYTIFFGGSNTYMLGVTPQTYGNSHAILNNLGGSSYCTSPSNCAAYAANVYTGNTGNDPVGTWYLPSKDELVLVKNLDDMIAQGIISTTPAGYTPLATSGNSGSSCTQFGGQDCIYWSSSESALGASIAWYVASTTGYVLANYKTNQFGVRAVRAFSY